MGLGQRLRGLPTLPGTIRERRTDGAAGDARAAGGGWGGLGLSHRVQRVVPAALMRVHAPHDQPKPCGEWNGRSHVRSWDGIGTKGAEYWLPEVDGVTHWGLRCRAGWHWQREGGPGWGLLGPLEERGTGPEPRQARGGRDAPLARIHLQPEDMHDDTKQPFIMPEGTQNDRR